MIQPLRAEDEIGASRGDRRTLGVALSVFGVLVLFFAVTSRGFLTADALTHFLYAKYAFDEPHYFVNVWGRPLCTALYAAPAAVGGLVGVRITSLLLGMTCAYATYRIAAGQGMRWPVLAAVFTLGQPLLFLHSFSEMTELPFATLIALAFWAYQGRRFAWMALLVALSPLARPEGLGFMVLAAIALACHRRGWLILLLPAPLLLLNHAGWEIFNRPGPWWMWLPSQFPYSRNSLYPPGYLFQFIALLPVVVSPLVLPATLLGIWRALRGAMVTWRQGRANVQYVSQSSAASKLGRAIHFDATEGPGDAAARAAAKRHVQRCRVLTALIPLWILATHSLLSWMGKLGSFGEARYLLIVAPFWGLLSARGWEWTWLRLGWRHPLRWAAAAVLAPLPVALALGQLPLPVADHWETAERAARWYESSPLSKTHPRIVASHVAVYYYLGISPTDPARTIDWRRDVLMKPPPGVILIWDPLYAQQNASADRAIDLAELQAAGWEYVGQADRVLNGPPGEGVSLDAYRRWNVFRSPAMRIQSLQRPLRVQLEVLASLDSL